MSTPRAGRYVSLAVLLTAGILVAAPNAQAASAGPDAQSESVSTVTNEIQPSPRIPRGAAAIGPVSASASVQGAVVLKPRDGLALTNFIKGITDRASPSYRDYLGPGQFAGEFGPTATTLAAVKAALETEGLSVDDVSTDGLFVSFTGSAHQVEKAFRTGLTRYRLADGSLGQATTSGVEIPAAIAGSVSAVIGLDNLARARPASTGPIRGVSHGSGRPKPRTDFAHPAGSPSPCTDAVTAAEEYNGLTDDQIANAYGAFGLYNDGDTGSGQHIALFELEPFATSDIHTFDACYFGSSSAERMIHRLTVVPVDGGEPSGPGSGEALLDIEDVSAMAPGANLDVYEAPNTSFGLVDNYAAIVDNDKDSIVTTTWGECEQAVQLSEPGVQQAESLLFQQAAAQGQSIFSAAGDTGDDDCDAFEAQPQPGGGQNPLSVDDPSSQPYVVAVGGTDIEDASQPPVEQAWNEGGQGGGGGISETWAMPAWQQDSSVPGIALPGGEDYAQANSVETTFGYPTGFCQNTLPGASSSTPCRLLPDVSAQADPYQGAVTVYSSEFDGWITLGGTSSAAPTWAAMLALVNSSSACASDPSTQHGVGFVNPLLYAVASDPTAYAASYNDITTGDNDVYNLDNGQVFPATPGFDLATGLGSPRLTGPNGTPGLADNLCATAAMPGTVSVDRLAPSVLPVSGGKVTITGTGFRSGGNDQVAGITVGSWSIPAGSINVRNATSITASFPPSSFTLPPTAPPPQDGTGAVDVIVTLRNGDSSAPSPQATIQYVDGTHNGPVPSVNGVSPYGGSQDHPGPVTILGSAFTAATQVTFGGVSAPGFTVQSPNKILVTPPPLGAQACAPSLPDQTPTTDVCQVQVRVVNHHGSSAEGDILPPYEGAVLAPNAMGVPALPPGCGCEQMPAPTEYDYVPQPTITSVSTSEGPADYADEYGGTLITVTGTGFDPLTLDWASFGNPSLGSSVNYCIFPECTYLSGTEMQIYAPSDLSNDFRTSVEPSSIPLSIASIGGQSDEVNVTYAGVPTVSSVLNSATERNGAADSGGTPIELQGAGFDEATGPINFEGPSFGTQSTYSVESDSTISTQSIAESPGAFDVEVCSATGCSYNPPKDVLYLYPPGNPKVDSASPASGPAQGGTSVTVSGENLGCVTAVYFGKVAAVTYTKAQAILACGSPGAVTVTAPPGAIGTVVRIRVETVESQFTRPGHEVSLATFTYS